MDENENNNDNNKRTVFFCTPDGVKKPRLLNQQDQCALTVVTPGTITTYATVGTQTTLDSAAMDEAVGLVASKRSEERHYHDLIERTTKVHPLPGASEQEISGTITDALEFLYAECFRNEDDYDGDNDQDIDDGHDFGDDHGDNKGIEPCNDPTKADE